MGRPRYHINPKDWFDCLDWFEYQLSQPHWLTDINHPIHSFGLSTLKECLTQWREIEHPTIELCESVQQIVEPSFTLEDWARLRKSLSARKRRRKEKQLDIKPVNITLTDEAHRQLKDYKNYTASTTLSEAILNALSFATESAKKAFEQKLQQQLKRLLGDYKPSIQVSLIDSYLVLAQQRRSLANSCKIAYQLFKKRPEASTLSMAVDRLIEDLIWNEVHLKVKADALIAEIHDKDSASR